MRSSSIYYHVVGIDSYVSGGEIMGMSRSLASIMTAMSQLISTTVIVIPLSLRIKSTREIQIISICGMAVSILKKKSKTGYLFRYWHEFRIVSVPSQHFNRTTINTILFMLDIFVYRCPKYDSIHASITY